LDGFAMENVVIFTAILSILRPNGIHFMPICVHLVYFFPFWQPCLGSYTGLIFSGLSQACLSQD
jgi:hypothetical protein